MTDWYVGQKVVCVVGIRFWTSTWRCTLNVLSGRWPAPRKGRVYQIAALKGCPPPVGIAFGLQSLPPHLRYGSGGFRPLVSQDADLSVFENILARLPARGREAVR